MNPYDFYYLKNFMSFSSLSSNYENLNMVSSPRFRSSETRTAFAITPIPKKSFIVYHQEIYTVFFNPPSFLMVYSIICHLWKKSLPFPLFKNHYKNLQFNLWINKNYIYLILFFLIEIFIWFILYVITIWYIHPKKKHISCQVIYHYTCVNCYNKTILLLV
jgi:hypothetical protein